MVRGMQRLEIPIRELRIEPALVVDYLTKRLRHYVREIAGKKGGVIGLSGGIDSTVTAYLAVRALGPENVTCMILPSSVTPKEDLEDAFGVINRLGIPEGNVRIVEVEPVVNSIVSALDIRDRVVKGNVTARVRMVILHAEAAVRNSLVIGTSDKSELTIGYFTKYGDGGVDVMPLADLYKTQVRQLARYLGVPERIIEKPPFAEAVGGPHRRARARDELRSPRQHTLPEVRQVDGSEEGGRGSRGRSRDGPEGRQDGQVLPAQEDDAGGLQGKHEGPRLRLEVSPRVGVSLSRPDLLP
jgi:NAD+ synthetase